MKRDVTTSPVNAPPPPGWLLCQLGVTALNRLIVRLIELRLGTAGSPKPSQYANDQGDAS